jgi:hypothetical protein
LASAVDIEWAEPVVKQANNRQPIMHRIQQIAFFAVSCLAGTAMLADSSPLPGSAAATDEAATGAAPEVIAQVAARLIAGTIPHEYERAKDWGRTKHITTGLRSSGNFFDFDIHRRKTDVNHGVWKKYRVTLVDPDTNMVVKIENLRSMGPGRFALTLYVTAKIHGWARAKVYDRGIHLIALEAEVDTNVRLWLNAEIAVESASSHAFMPGIAIRPLVTGAKLKLDDFRLTRISDLRGAIAHELGDGIRHVIEDELTGDKLVAKLNHSIEKRRDKLEFTPTMLLEAAR